MATDTKEKPNEKSYDKIYRTKDYSKFKILKCNRSISALHLKRLKESLIQTNQLKLHPIIVTSDFEVIDGQHRLEAAQQLDLSIYYIISEDVKRNHIIECNANQKPFDLQDYIRFSVEETKNKDYIRLRDLLIKTGLKTKSLLNLLFVKTSNEMIRRLKTGNFKLPAEEDLVYYINHYMQFKEYIATKNLTPQTMFIYYKFTRAFHYLITSPGFENAIFYKKLDHRWHTLRPCATAQEWYKLLISIYNFKNITHTICPIDVE